MEKSIKLKNEALGHFEGYFRKKGFVLCNGERVDTDDILDFANGKLSGERLFMYPCLNKGITNEMLIDTIVNSRLAVLVCPNVDTNTNVRSIRIRENQSIKRKTQLQEHNERIKESIKLKKENIDRIVFEQNNSLDNDRNFRLQGVKGTLKEDIDKLEAELSRNILEIEEIETFAETDRLIDTILSFKNDRQIEEKEKRECIKIASAEFLASEGVLVVNELSKRGFFKLILNEINRGKVLDINKFFK